MSQFMTLTPEPPGLLWRNNLKKNKKTTKTIRENKNRKKNNSKFIQVRHLMNQNKKWFMETQRKNQVHRDYNAIKISENTKESPGYMKRHIFNQASAKEHQFFFWRKSNLIMIITYTHTHTHTHTYIYIYIYIEREREKERRGEERKSETERHP